MTIFTIGCDPEVFVTRKGKPHSAFGLLEGTKEKPHKTELGAYQVDGMAAEFNTDPVNLTTHYNGDSFMFETWNERIVSQMKAIREALPDDCSIRAVPVMDFGQEFLDQQPDEAKELGCDPDYSAYTLKPNPRPDGEATFRTGAGHIHIGWGADIPVNNEEHIQICADFVKVLDATVGMLMTYIDREPRRRLLYGKAGAFRPKPYGVEYRTPSNVWINNRDMRKAVWVLTQEAIARRIADTPVSQIIGLETKSPQEIIDTGDHAAALTALDYIFEKRHRRLSWGQYRQPSYLRRIIRATERKYNNA